MKKNRTQIDWSKHEVIIKESEYFSMHWLKIPGTITRSVKFINTNGILAVTGDFGNWIFCREFHPTSSEERVYDGYWMEKLQISSCQEPEKYDPESTEKAIREALMDTEMSKEYKYYLINCLNHIEDSEFDYKYHAYHDLPNGLDYESIIHKKKTHEWLLVVFDSFEEICSRLATSSLKEETNTKK